MPTEASIGVSKDTLKLVKDYQKEFAFKSLDEAVENSIRWARLWSYVDSQQRRSIVERLNDLEAQVQKLSKLFTALLITVFEIKNKGEKKNV